VDVARAVPAQGRPRLGFLVNPIAGIGGRVGLKGSDGPETPRLARDLGATAEAGDRGRVALESLHRYRPDVEVVTWPGEMGADAALAAGFRPVVLGDIRPGLTTAADTRAAARSLRDAGVGLIAYTGGDGTARDVLEAVGGSVPTLGIPAGVKVYSATFAINPARAGELAGSFLCGGRAPLHECEVLDLDEEAYRLGHVTPRLAGYLRVPFRAGAIQAGKTPSAPGDGAALAGIAAQVTEQIPRGALCVLGPGTTLRSIAVHMGVPKTLTGVDVVRDGKLIAADVGEATLVRLGQAEPLTIVLTPIGGQGFILGRGNPQVGPRVLEHVEREALVIVATPAKLAALQGRPLLIDTGDGVVDAAWSGYLPVITGYRERSMYRVGDQPEG